MENIITPEDAIIYIDGHNKTYFRNTPDGRAQMLADCAAMSLMDAYHEVLSVWGDNVIMPTLAELKNQKRSDIATARFDAETAGTTVNGILIDTGRDSQALITGAALAAMLDSEYSLNWKTVAGFIHLSAPEIIAVAQAVRAHVQSCFDKEGELVALVDAAKSEDELNAIEISFE